MTVVAVGESGKGKIHLRLGSFLECDVVSRWRRCIPI